MKIIKKIFLAVVMLLTFTSCMGLFTSPASFKTNVAPINASQRTILLANYPKNGYTFDMSANLGFLNKWKVTEIDFWEVENLNFKQRKETFLIVVDKLATLVNSSYGNHTIAHEGYIKVYDLRTGNLIINHHVHGESVLRGLDSVKKALNSLVVK